LVSFITFAFDTRDDFLVLDHNRIHATDVLHAVFYMTVQSIPDFIQVTPDDDYKNPDTGWFSDRTQLK